MSRCLQPGQAGLRAGYGGNEAGWLTVVVGLPMPYGMSATMARLRKAADDYWTAVSRASPAPQYVHAAAVDDDEPGAFCFELAGRLHLV